MSTAVLTVDLDAIAANWRALDAMTSAETGAVIKANGYGLDAGRVARALMRAGARRFFVAAAEEGAAVRQAVGPDPEICVFSGHMRGDTDTIGDLILTPMLNSVEQLTRHFESLPGHPFGIQLDTGMNRLGVEMLEWQAVAPILVEAGPELLMSHLACADEPDAALNEQQLAMFHAMTDGTGVPRSFAATGGILLGPRYHFDLTRPGVGLYGGLPFDTGMPTVALSLPVIQMRELAIGETVGYSCAWTAESPSLIATVAGGYADGLLRALGNRAVLWAGDVPWPVVGRVSMDAITVDISHLEQAPRKLDILGPHQTIDDLAEAGDTIGYEILTGLGSRYARRYIEGTGRS